MHEDKIVQAIFHYQQNLERYIDKRNEGKMIYCMEKLQQLPITVSHLEYTGVGRTVNSVRKMKGIKAPKTTAKQLVSQWKKMVTEEEQNESDDANSNHEDDDNDDCEDADEDRLQIYSENEDNVGMEDKKEETRNIEMQHSSHYEEPDVEKYENFRERYSEHKYCDSDRVSYDHVDTDRVETKETRIVKHTSPNCTYDDYTDYYGNQDGHDDLGDNDNNLGSIENAACSNDDDHDDSDTQINMKSSEASLDKSRDNADNCKTSTENKSERERSKSKKHKSSDRSLERHDSKSKDRHKSKEHRDGEKDKEKENHQENGHEKNSSDKKNKHGKHKSSKSSSSSSHKESHKYKEKEKEKDNSSTSNSKQKDQSRQEEKEVEPVPSTSEKRASSSLKKRPQEDIAKSTPSKKVKLSIDDGIDCESGASFGEALGCIMMPSTSKSHRKDKKDSPKLKDKDRDREKDKDRKHRHKESKSHKDKDEHRERSEKKADKKDNKTTAYVPTALKGTPSSLKLIPLEDVAITNLLPQISTNYKPVGHLPGENNPRTSNKAMYDDEMLSKLMYSKNQRTKVYSGNKVLFGKVPSLFDLCIRVLQDHIDTLALGYTGGVPYSILKPVLERATPSQLFNLEHYNTYLMEDSNELWLLHCQREFKAKQRNEMETWRDMYLRCIDERDAKLKSLTANIKLAQDKSVPVRQTKLAYVDAIVKPPRNIAKKQAKNGIIISGKPAVTPSSRLTQLALSGGADKIAVPNPGAHRVNSSSGGNSSGGNNYTVKPKKAPLMAKTLQLMRGRFRK